MLELFLEIVKLYGVWGVLFVIVVFAVYHLYFKMTKSSCKNDSQQDIIIEIKKEIKIRVRKGGKKEALKIRERLKEFEKEIIEEDDSS